MRHRYAILEAPSALGHIPEHLGVERAPGVLLESGLADGLGARQAGCLPARGYSSVRDPRTKVMNPQPLHDYSRSLADEVGAILDNGEFPVVLGGDCSLLLGTMLALRRRGRYGVLYVDGDADFYQPEASPLRGAASASDLAFATGRGPDIVCDIEGRRPLVRDGDVAVLACRDAADRERRGCQPLPPDMLVLDREHVRQAGAEDAARQAVTFLTRHGGPPDGFWIHLDADVFDQTIMQSVDDPRPGGLTWDDGIAVLRTAIASSQAAGLQVAIYTPTSTRTDPTAAGWQPPYAAPLPGSPWPPAATTARHRSSRTAAVAMAAAACRRSSTLKMPFPGWGFAAQLTLR